MIVVNILLVFAQDYLMSQIYYTNSGTLLTRKREEPIDGPVYRCRPADSSALACLTNQPGPCVHRAR